MAASGAKFIVGIILLSFLNWVGAADTTYPKEVLGIQTGDLIEAATDVTKSGSVIIKYQQVHCGFPVLGSQAVLEKMDKGDGVWGEIHDNQITAQMQELLPESCIGASPSLSKQALYEQTVQQENDNIANLIPFNETLDAVTYWIYQEQSHEIRLTCQLTYVIVSNSSNNTNAPLRKTFHVDAKTSEITLRDVSVVSFSYDMTGIGGNIIIGKHEFGNWDWAGRKLRVNRLNSDKCEAVNDYVKVHSGDGTITCGNKVAKQDCDSHNMYSSHSFNQVNDALFYTTDFLEMLKNQYYDTSLPKFCGQMYTCVNYGAYDNAYYTSCQTYYGLGNVHFYGLATADVVAHELCHGVTAATSGLYYWAESGGMNEAFSDICGETYEAFLNHGNNDWKIGYGIMKNPSGNDALRYMFWPPKDDRSIQCQSDYKKGLDVHYSSGLYNKAFYLLANTKGWCIKRAFQVFLRANKFIWQPASKFNSGACGVIWAAGLFGYSTSDVEDAFAAVGIFCECPPGFVKRNEWSCYKFVEDLASWAEAKTTCESIGATLAVVEEIEEYTWIQEQLTDIWTQPTHHDLNGHAAYWIGASDQAVEGDWKWSSVSRDLSVDFFAWGFNQPDNQNGFQDCIAISSYYYNLYFKYYDDDCQDRKYFLCERTCAYTSMNI